MRGCEIIRIAIVVWDLTISGGTQRQALELARYLRRQGHEADIFCGRFDDGKCYPELLAGLKVSALHKGSTTERRKRRGPSMRWMFYPIEPLSTREERELAEMIPEGYALINPHEHRAYRVAHHYKKRHRVPSVWMVNDLPRSLRIPRWGGTRKGIVRWLHYNLLLGRFGLVTDRKRIRSMDYSVVFDDPTALEFEKTTGVKPEKMGSGLDLSAFSFKKKSIQPGQKNISMLAVGVFYPHRRFEDIVLAVERLVQDGFEPRLTIVGTDRYDPEYGSRIRNLVQSKKLGDHIEFLGEVSEERLRELYASSEVFVFPNFPQTWGLAPFEAMASGTPAIVCRSAGAAAILTDRENALLVPEASPGIIAENIVRLLREPDLYDRLSAKGREFVEKNVTWDAYGSRMETLMADAVQKSAGVASSRPKD